MPPTPRSDRSPATSPPRAETVLTDRVYRIGGHVALDGRLSWAAKRPGRSQPLSGYLVKYDDRAYLLDTGVTAHRQIVVPQFEGLLPKGFPVTAYLTRSDYQCIGNLEALNDAHQFDEIAFKHRSPFAAFDDVSRNLKNVPQTTLKPGFGEFVPLSASDDLVVFPAVIRVLGTTWVYSKSYRVLFSSDWFFHTDVADGAQSSILDNLRNDESTYESAVEHVLEKYHWLARADTRPLSAWLEKIFESFDVEVIAPNFGCVLKGRGMVAKHYALVQDMLTRLGRNNG